MIGETDTMEKFWLFVLRTDHIPGVAANIAVAFSRRGIQIDSICAEGDLAAAESTTPALVSVTFAASTPRMEIIRRKLERLEVVRSLKVWNCDSDPALKKRVEDYVSGRQTLLGDLMSAHPPFKTTVRQG